jgi:hypothetical protein
VFEAEWVFLVLGSWCGDVREHDIMWRLSGRASGEIAEIGVKNLFQEITFSPEEVQLWLTDHNAKAWDWSRMSHRVIDLSGSIPAQSEVRVQFVSAYQL